MLEIILRDRFRNEKIRKRTGVDDVLKRITRTKWRWTGHIAKPNDGRWTGKIGDQEQTSKTEADLQPHGPIHTIWMATAQNRERWKYFEEAYDDDDDQELRFKGLSDSGEIDNFVQYETK